MSVGAADLKAILGFFIFSLLNQQFVPHTRLTIIALIFKRRGKNLSKKDICKADVSFVERTTSSSSVILSGPDLCYISFKATKPSQRYKIVTILRILWHHM